MVEEPNSPEFLNVMEQIFSHAPEDIRTSFPEGETHMRLAQNSVDQCVFLGPNGCLLPNPARPIFCQIYPFWFTGEQIQVFGDHNCLALKTAETIPRLCSLLGTNPDHLFSLYCRLCKVWGVPPPNKYQLMCG